MNGLLFIDDEEGVRRSVVRALKKEPYNIYTADNGKGGIDQNPPPNFTDSVSNKVLQRFCLHLSIAAKTL